MGNVSKRQLRLLRAQQFLKCGKSHPGFRLYLDEQAQAVDDDVRQALDLCDGDAVRALRITLIANAFLVEENEQLKKQISKDYTRKK